MASHNELGKDGEQLALAWLREKGYEILHCNWRYARYEVDIIAGKNGMLHIIEIKTRKFYPGAFPEESVTKKKFSFLKNAADEYLYRHPEYRNVRFDILAITLFRDKEPEYFLIEDVFL
jgi:putative endonuclease